MTLTNESGGIRGAISSMVGLVDVCPSCGKPQTDHRRPTIFSNSKGCPDASVGAFPFIPAVSDTVDTDDAPSPSAGTPPGRFPGGPEEPPIGLYASDPSPNGARRGSLLTATWALTGGAEEFP